MRPQPATVLLSGGLDSTVLLHTVAKRLGHTPIHVLSFDYGQKHHRELDMARRQVAEVPQATEHQILDLAFFARLTAASSALVAGGPAVPDLDDVPDAERCQPPTYVPNRNMILLALAAAYAEARQCRLVYYGAQAQDRYGYWDCTEAFIDAMNKTLALNRGCAVHIVAPFATERKASLVRLGHELGVNFAHTWSCYRGGERPCGTCPTCRERQNAFREAGIPDPGSEAWGMKRET